MRDLKEGWLFYTHSGGWIALLAVLILLPRAAPNALAAEGGSIPDPAAQVASAQVLIAKVSRSSFGPGKRAPLLRAAMAAVRTARGKKPCAALVAVDRALNLLESPLTWRERKVPRARTRKPASLMGLASRELLRRAGLRCARAPASKTLAPHAGGSGDFAPVQPPEVENEQGKGVVKSLRPGRLRVPKKLGGGTAPVGDGQGIRLLRRAAGVPLAPPSSASGVTVDPLGFFRSSDVGALPGGGPTEPTAAIGRNVVWYTGNVAVGLSTDAGRTFTTFNPSSVLPDASRGFCCDQLVSYSPSSDLLVWVTQYWCQTACMATDSAGRSFCPPQTQPNGSNRVRIAVATPEALIANASDPRRAWTYWDITPQLLGQPANAWFDRSDLALNPWNMNWSVDVICGNASSVLGRISPAGLARRSTVTLSWITDTPQRMQTAQGGQTFTTYFTGNNSGSQARIWSWSPFTGTLFLHNIDHSSVPLNNAAVTGTDGANWYGRYGIFPGAVESSTVSGTTLYLAQGTGRDLCTAVCNTKT